MLSLNENQNKHFERFCWLFFFLNGYAFLNLYPMITGRELFLLLNNMIMLKDRIDIDTFTLICRTHTLNTIICLYHINPCTYFFGIQVTEDDRQTLILV